MRPMLEITVTIPAFPASDVLAARQKLVLDHFHDEVRHAWDDVLSTFPHPRYELIPQMVVHDGDQAVRNTTTTPGPRSRIRTTKSSPCATAQMR